VTDVTFGARVAARAVDVKPGRMLLVALAALLYVPGFVVGLLWVALTWSLAALVEGFVDARRTSARLERET
jgi:hypothetical protein